VGLGVVALGGRAQLPGAQHRHRRLQLHRHQAGSANTHSMPWVLCLWPRLSLSLSVVFVSEQRGHGRDRKGLYELGLTMQVCKAPFQRTVMLAVAPRYMLVNRLDAPIEYSQTGCVCVCALVEPPSAPGLFAVSPLRKSMYVSLAPRQVPRLVGGHAASGRGGVLPLALLRQAEGHAGGGANPLARPRRVLAVIVPVYCCLSGATDARGWRGALVAVERGVPAGRGGGRVREAQEGSYYGPVRRLGEGHANTSAQGGGRGVQHPDPAGGEGRRNTTAGSPLGVNDSDPHAFDHGTHR
jgi:hypothetical protein